MNTSELKINVIERILQLKDSKIVEEIQRLLDFETNKGVYHLNNTQINRVEEARAEYKNGSTFTEDEANNQIDEWLKK